MARTRTLPTKVDFGEYLSKLMAARGLNNAELARLAGKESGSVSRWKRGEEVPSIPSLRKIAPLLGVRHGDLIVAIGESSPEELGMVGAPPAPGPPLPAVIRRIVAWLLDPRIPDRRKQQLLTLIDRCGAMWWENLQDEVFNEPKLTSARSLPRRRS